MFRFNQFWNCDFYYIDFFFKKNYDWIRPPLEISMSFYENNYNDWIKQIQMDRAKTSISFSIIYF